MFTLEKKFRFRPHAMIQYGTLNASFIEGIKSLCQHNLSLFVFLGRMHNFIWLNKSDGTYFFSDNLFIGTF